MSLIYGEGLKSGVTIDVTFLHTRICKSQCAFYMVHNLLKEYNV